jgi:hypothetical protein
MRVRIDLLVSSAPRHRPRARRFRLSGGGGQRAGRRVGMAAGRSDRGARHHTRILEITWDSYKTVTGPRPIRMLLSPTVAGPLPDP